MIQFILKGIVRDKNRSLLLIIIVALGVTLTVFLSGNLAGLFHDVIQKNARFETGHVKIMSKAYAQNKDSGRAVIAAVNYAVERDQYDKPLGIIDIKKYDNDPKKFFQDKSVYKGPGNYILGGSVIKIDEQGNATTIKKYYTSKKNEGFLAKFGFGGD